jgi:isocitrate dehydrogenase kinase/phosphatase
VERSLHTERGTEAIELVFHGYYESHKKTTRHALSRWENQDWHGIQEASRKRPRLYPQALDAAERQLTTLVPLAELRDPAFWGEMKKRYIVHIEHRYEADLALTFFYSVHRRLFSRAGVPVEYQDDGIAQSSHIKPEHTIYRTYKPHHHQAPAELVAALLMGYQFHIPFVDLPDRCKGVEDRLKKALDGRAVDAIDVLNTIFFRNKGAYVVG